MELCGSTRPSRSITEGLNKIIMMCESSTLARILAYVAKNKLIVALEVEYQEMMDVEALLFEFQTK